MEILKVHCLFQDGKWKNYHPLASTTWYNRIQALQETEMRCQFVGYDTQEVPRPGERDADMPQPFWQEGRF
jgi:hypothetical protein